MSLKKEYEMRFIELHDYQTSGMILININQIISIDSLGVDGSRISTVDGLIRVKETPDQIKIKIHG